MILKNKYFSMTNEVTTTALEGPTVTRKGVLLAYTAFIAVLFALRALDMLGVLP